MKRIPLAILSLSSLLFWQCGVQTDIASNYYDDGIYFDPTYASIYMDSEVDEIAPGDYYSDTSSDYYNPNDYSFIEEQSGTQGNWYGGMNSGVYGSPYGWNSNIGFTMGYQWGDYGMYPSYGYDYPGYGMGMGMYNPYSPFCSGYGYPGYSGYGFGYPYYPPYGYGYGYGTPVYGNDFGGFWQGAHSPDVVYTGNSGPRGSRNNVGGSSPVRGSEWPSKSGKTTLNTTNVAGGQSQSSKLRASSIERQGKRHVASPRAKTTTKKYYQRVAQPSKAKKSTSITNTGRSYRKSPNYGNSLQRQTNKVVKSRSGNGATLQRNNSGGTRSYNTTTKSRSATPSRSTPSRSSRSSSRSSTKTNTTTRSRR